MESVSPFAHWSRITGRTRLCCVLQLVRDQGTVNINLIPGGVKNFAASLPRTSRHWLILDDMRVWQSTAVTHETARSGTKDHLAP
jgi:hypothetical protein